MITPNKLTWIFSDLICPKNTNEKNFDSWAKTEDYPLRKMSIFLDLSKLWFSGLKLILFYLGYQRTIFSNIISSKTLMRKSLNFGQKPCTNLLGKGRFLALLRTLPFWSKRHSFLSKILKTIFSHLIIPKKPNEKKFDFWIKPIDYALTIMSIFWHFLKR